MTPDRSKQIKDIVRNLLKKYHLERPVYRQQLFIEWEKIVGVKFAKKCKPKSVENDVLFLEAKDSIWQKELARNHKHIAQLLKEILEKARIKEVKITQGNS